MNICLVNEAGLADADLAIITKAVQYFVPLVTSAWKLPTYTVSTSTTAQAGAWNIYLTERNRHVGATGWHGIEGGLPVAYCSPRASYRLFGKYYKPFVIKGKQIYAARYSEGLVTTICHEIAEMLCDQKITTYSAPDSQGRKWLVEVCDHVFGSFLIYTVAGTDCVLPDVTTPAFYDLKGIAPYSLNNAVSAPFTMTVKGYGYYAGAKGLTKI